MPTALVAYKLGCNLTTVQLNFRAENNTQQHAAPLLKAPFDGNALAGKRVLLVDDVSVSGSTLAAAQSLLMHSKVTTFVMKGTAELVLFPELKTCVHWPWNAKPI